MSTNKMKSLAKDTAIYGLSSILGRFLNWGLTPFYSHIFIQTEEFGKISHIYSFTAIALIFLTYGMETGFFRFMNKEGQNVKVVYPTILTSLAVTSLLFILFSFGFIDQLSSLLKYTVHPEHILIMAVVVALDAFLTIPFAQLRYQKRPIRFATIKLTFIFSSILLSIFFLLVCPHLYQSNPSLIDWFYSPAFGIGYVFVANLISTLITFAMLLPTMKGIEFAFDKKFLSKILKYSTPFVVLGIAGFINQNVTFFYPYIYDDTTTAFAQSGIYNACLKISLVIVMFTQAFRFAYEPFVFEQNKNKAGTDVYAQTMKYFFIFSVLIFMAVVYYVDVIILLLGENYRVGVSIIPVAMMGEVFFGIYFNLSIWYKLTDKTMFGAVFSIIGCFVTLLINFLFVPVYGYMASAWAIFFCNLLMVGLSYYFGQKHFPVKYDIRNLLFYIGLAAIFYILGTQIAVDNMAFRLVFRTLLLLLFTFIVIKKDIPLSQIPLVNKYFSKKK